LTIRLQLGHPRDDKHEFIQQLLAAVLVGLDTFAICKGLSVLLDDL